MLIDIMKSVVIALTFLFAVWTMSCGEKSDPPAAREIYRRAVDAQGAGNVEEAEALFRRVAEEFPNTRVATEAQEQIRFLENLREIERRGRARRAVEHLKAIARACERYRAAKGQYPTSITELTPEWLATVPEGVWGHPYHYRTETDAKGRRHKYFLACFGSDGIPGGTEDAFDLIVKDGEFVQIHEWLR